MSRDFLEQLAELEISQPPPEFDRRLHERLNRALFWQHVLDLLVGALPWAALHFARAVWAAVSFSLTGKVPGDSPEEPKKSR
jgi:hypothetical protein